MKVLKGIFYTFLTAFLLLVFYIFFGGAICNDIKASHIEKEYAVMELPIGVVKTMDIGDWIANNYSVELYPITTNISENFFSSLEEPISSVGYFVINQFYDAFTQFDLRTT